jgi:hypothetical protein
VPGALVGEAALAMHRHLMREAIRGHQRPSEVIRVGEAALAMHRHLMREAIRGHQRSSEAIRGSAREASHLPEPIVRKELLVPVEGLADRVVDEETSKEARRHVRPVAHLWGEGVRAPS